MTTPQKKPSHIKPPPKTSIIALLTAVVTLLGSIFGWWSTTHPSQHQVKQAAAPIAAKVAKRSALNAVNREAARAVGLIANSAPPANQPCPVLPGQGAMGACAPKVASTLRLAGASPSGRISGHPIGTDTSSFQSCEIPPSFVTFWIVKATEGTGYRDRCAAKNIADAKRLHLIYGTYDFMRATGRDATSEADAYTNYARAVGATRGLHVLDVEANSRGLSSATLHAYICDWVRRVKGQFGGQIVIYTGSWFWSPNVGGSTCGAVLWDSAYASYAALPSTWGGGFLTTSGWTATLGRAGRYRASTPLWQYGDGVYGPEPRVNRWDSDAFFGSRSQLAQLAGLEQPCSQRTVCRMGRRHAHVHRTIVAKCHGKAAPSHRAICRKLRARNSYMHRYARRHHLGLFVTR